MTKRIFTLVTALVLAVGAWADVVVYDNSEGMEVTSTNSFTLDKSKLSAAIRGSVLTITFKSVTPTGDGMNFVLQAGEGWRATWIGSSTTQTSFILNSTNISHIAGSSNEIKFAVQESNTCVITNVTLDVFNFPNLITKSPAGGPDWYGNELDKSLLSSASAGDKLKFTISSVGGSKRLILQDKTGRITDTDNTEIFNTTTALDETTGIAIGNDAFSAFVETDILKLEGTENSRFTVYCNNENIGGNPYWHTTDIALNADLVTSLKTYGIVVKGTGSLAKVIRGAVPAGRPSVFADVTDFSAGNVYVTLTSEMLASEKLVLGGWDFTFTSLDLIYTPTVNINATAGYATFSYAADVDLTEIEAYTAAVSGDKVVLTSIKGKKVAAGTGIVLKGSGDVGILLATESTDEITGNELKVSDGTVTGDGSTIYVLANKSPNGVGFYLLKSGSTVTVGKAYLRITSSLSAPAREYIGFGDGNTTGMEQIFREASTDSIYYTLHGQRVDKPNKGLYIVNGKKVIIK